MQSLIFLTVSFFFLTSELIAQINSKLDFEKKEVELRVQGIQDEYFVGSKIPISVELRALADIEVFDLETAWLGYELNFSYRDGDQVVMDQYAAGTGGSYKYINDTISGETVFYEIDQNRIFLKKGEVIDREIELIELFKNGFLGAGKYTLEVVYESQIETQSTFDIVIDYNQSIPTLITSLENKEVFGGITASTMIYYLTGYERLLQIPSTKINEHFEAVPLMHSWWEKHRELILKVESVLNQEQYKNMLYDERVPELLINLEKGEYQERLEAKNELYQILGKPEWKPSASDTDEEIQSQIKELSNWWEENKELINWVNRVILENQID